MPITRWMMTIQSVHELDLEADCGHACAPCLRISGFAQAGEALQCAGPEPSMVQGRPGHVIFLRISRLVKDEF
jgi:hypothetical protein